MESGSGDDKRDKNGPDFTIDNTAGGPVEDKPAIIKINPPRGSQKTSAMNRRAFLKGTLTTGAGLVGIAGTIGSSGSDNEDDTAPNTPPPANNGNDDNNNNDDDDNNNDNSKPVTGKQCSTTYQPSHTGLVTGVAIDSTGRRVVSAGQDGEKATAKVWDTVTGNLLLTYQGHTGTHCLCATFSPDGDRVATSGYQDALHIWDTATGELVTRYAAGANAPQALAFSPDGNKIAAFGVSTQDHIIDAHSGTLLATHSGHTATAMCGVYSPDGSLAVSGDHQKLRLWDPATGDLIRTYDGHQNYSISAVAFSPDGTKVASGGSASDGVHIWECDTGNLVSQYLRGKNESSHIRCIAFHPDGRTLATGDTVGNVDIWDCVGGEHLARYYGHIKHLTGLVYSPDGTRIISGSNDKCIHIRSSANGAMELTLADDTLNPLTASVDCVPGFGCATNPACICNTVCTCEIVCTCDTVCTCESYSGGGGGGGGGGGHYWYPN